MFHDTEARGPSFSLLVFQAMLFVACSVGFNTSILRGYTLCLMTLSLTCPKYISLNDARQSGAESILIMRNTFYQRAKVCVRMH